MLNGKECASNDAHISHVPGILKPGGGGLKLRLLTSSGLSCKDAATCSMMFSMMKMPGKSPGPLGGRDRRGEDNCKVQRGEREEQQFITWLTLEDYALERGLRCTGH